MFSKTIEANCRSHAAVYNPLISFHYIIYYTIYCLFHQLKRYKTRFFLFLSVFLTPFYAKTEVTALENIILALFIATVRAAFLESLGQGKGTPLFMSQNRRRQCCRKFRRTMRCRQRCKNAVAVSVREGEIKGMGLSILRNLLIIMTMFLSQNKKTRAVFNRSPYLRLPALEPAG